MSYLQSGTIDVGFVRVMLGIYASYVLLVLFADAHHVFYHAPKRARMELAAKDGGAGAEAGGESSSTPAVAKTTETRADGKGGGGSVANDCTPLLPPASSSPPAVRVAYARKHSHSLSETVIEAMSNYSCSADDDDEEEEEARMAGVDRWAPVQDDGTEPLVIFHPHHAVHPHHPGGPSLLRVSEEGGPARSRGVRMHSSSFDTVDEGPAHSSARPAGAACARLRSSSFEAATLPSKMTNAPSDIESEIDGGTPIVDDRSAHSPPSRCGGGGGRPSSWKEAYHANVKEFSDHWRDFFMDIYFNNDNQDKNDNNGLWDILALTVELPFTIARKVRLFFVCVFSLRVSSPSPSLTPFPNQLTNPVPCDGYYCRPLVAVSLTLSPLWLWFYFLDQFDVDIFSSHVGYVLSTMTLATGLVVIRFAPGGDGPMDFYMVVSSTAPH
jgi:sodium/potassium/calcium exchanger 6